MAMKDTARACARVLLNEAEKKRKWTPAERRTWATAFNACQRLAGKKTLWKRGRMVTS